MYVYEKMTKKAIIAKPEYSLSKAFQILKENHHSHLPVINEENQVIGIISKKLIEEVNPSKATSLSSYEINFLLSNTKVYEIMKPGAFTINKNKLIEDAALLMNENRLKILPVVDDFDELVGVITRFDIVKAFINFLSLKDLGTYISIKVSDAVSDIANITEVIKKHNIELRSMVKGTKNGEAALFIKIGELKPEAFFADLRKHGYNVEILSIQY